MGILRIAILVAVIGGGYHVLHHRRASGVADAAITPGPGEFVAAAMPDGATKDTVLILAPVNCPSDAAKRADSLARQLEGMGIPVVRSNRFSLHIGNPTAEDKASMEQAASVLRGEIPAVFING